MGHIIALDSTTCIVCFSRLQGSYEALKGGQTIEAMEDFTGGLGEDFDLKNVRKGGEKEKKEIFAVILKGLKRGDLMGCSITVSVWFFGRKFKACVQLYLLVVFIANNFCCTQETILLYMYPFLQAE